MLTDDQLAGIKKADLSEIREIKVKIPLRFLVNLNALKFIESKNISELVGEALSQYFAGFALPGSQRVGSKGPPTPQATFSG